MRFQYQSTITPQPPTVGLIAGNLTLARTLYFWLKSRTKAGVTPNSTVVAIAVEANQGIRITIPSTVRVESSDLEEVWILANTTNNQASAAIVAKWVGYDRTGIDGLPVPNSLPAQIDLTEEEHLALSESVATLAALPSSPVEGMRRAVDETGDIREYHLGAWRIAKEQMWDILVGSSTDPSGCDREIAYIYDEDLDNNASLVLHPTYGFSGDPSERVGFLLVNDQPSSVVTSGTRILVNFSANDRDLSAKLSGLIQLIPGGHVDLSTGSLDDSMPSVGGSFVYEGQGSILFLEEDLSPNHGYLFFVEMNAEPAQVPFLFNGTTLKIAATFDSRNATYSPGGELFGDYISPTPTSRCRVVPDGEGYLAAKSLAGKGRIGDYSFDSKEEIIPGLAANTDDQMIVITNNGICYKADSVPTTAKQRALVGTVNGLGHFSSWQGAIALDAASLLTLTVTPPNAIRSDYPDRIAGAACSPNTVAVRVAVQLVGGGDILVFEGTVATSTQQTIAVGTLAGVNMGASLPSPASNFGLFNPPTIDNLNTSAGVSVFSSGTYRVAIAYYYEDCLTRISHAEADGCIFEIGNDVIEALSSTQYWGAKPAEIRAIAHTEVLEGKTWRFGDQLYYWNSQSEASDDGEKVFLLTGWTGPGRVLLQQPLTGTALDDLWLGSTIRGDRASLSQWGDSVVNLAALKALTTARVDGKKFPLGADIYTYYQLSTLNALEPFVVQPNDGIGRFIWDKKFHRATSLPAAAPPMVGLIWQATLTSPSRIITFYAEGTASVDDWRPVHTSGVLSDTPSNLSFSPDYEGQAIWQANNTLWFSADGSTWASAGGGGGGSYTELLEITDAGPSFEILPLYRNKNLVFKDSSSPLITTVSVVFNVDNPDDFQIGDRVGIFNQTGATLTLEGTVLQESDIDNYVLDNDYLELIVSKVEPGFMGGYDIYWITRLFKNSYLPNRSIISGSSSYTITPDLTGAFLLITSGFSTTLTLADAASSADFPLGWYIDVKTASDTTILAADANDTFNEEASSYKLEGDTLFRIVQTENPTLTYRRWKIIKLQESTNKRTRNHGLFTNLTIQAGDDGYEFLINSGGTVTLPSRGSYPYTYEYAIKFYVQVVSGTATLNTGTGTGGYVTINNVNTNTYTLQSVDGDGMPVVYRVLVRGTSVWVGT